MPDYQESHKITIAACAFAALLFKVVNSPEVQEMLSKLIDKALKTAG
ncbi:DUF4244 domain-containing protein [Nonomuraea sp. NPDC049158]